MTFDNRINREHCCDNCIDDHIEIDHVPDFEKYDISVELGLMYVYTIKYFNFLLLSKCQKLLVTNPIRSPETIADQTCVYKKSLNNFSLWTWPDNGLASLNFLR